MSHYKYIFFIFELVIKRKHFVNRVYFNAKNRTNEFAIFFIFKIKKEIIYRHYNMTNITKKLLKYKK